MRELFKALQEGVSADLVLVHLVQALEGRLPAPAARARALPASCNRHWESARRCPRMIPPSLRQLEQSIRQPLSLISAFMVYHFCSSTPGRQILVSARPSPLDQACLSSSTTIVRLPTVLFSIFPRHWVRCTGSLSSSNCSLDLDLAQIFGICDSPATQRRSLIASSKTKSWPQ